MSECPNSECHKRLNDLADYVWGKLPDQGLKSVLSAKIQAVSDCAKAKVPKKWIWTFVCVFGLATITGGVGAVLAVDRSKRNEKQIEKVAEIVQKNEVERTKMKEQIRAIYEVVVKKNHNYRHLNQTDTNDDQE